MKNTLIAVALLAAAPFTTAHADSYAGVNHSFFDIDGGPEPMGLVGTYGHYIDFMGIDDFIGTQVRVAAEARLGIGLGDDDGVEIDSLIGAYLKPEFKLGHPAFRIYGLVGLTRLETSGSGGSNSDVDPSYGVGLNFHLNERVILNVEHLLEVADDVSQFSAGVRIPLYW